MMKEITILLFTLIISNSIFCQNAKVSGLFSKKASQGKVSGFLVGKYPGTNRFYYFEYPKKPLEASAWVNLRNKPPLKLQTNAIVPRGNGLDLIVIDLSFNKNEIQQIVKEEDPLSFEFEFRFTDLSKKVVRNGIFKVSNSMIWPADTATYPRTNVDFSPGFIVTAPEELSILLIKEEIDNYLMGATGSKYIVGTGKYNDDFLGQSNYTEKPYINADSITDVIVSINNPLTTRTADSLYQVAAIFHFCDKHLDSTSFLKFEGAELSKNIDSLQRIYSGFNVNNENKGVIADSLEFYNSWIIQKKNTLVEYQKTINRLEFVKSKMIYILRKSYLNFRN